MRNYFLYIPILFLFVACGSEENNGSKKVIEEIPSDDVADFIRMPISADKEVDLSKVSKMEFVEMEYDFGTVKQGTKVKHIYKFTNVGKVPLVITDARSTCGCTVPNHPKEPIEPGEGGEITVIFDTTNYLDRQGKPIIITANTYPNKVQLMIKGNIIK